VGVLAQPARALALLQKHAALNNEPVPGDDSAPEPDDVDERCPTCGDRGAGPVPFPVDPDRLRPRAVLRVRISEEALRSRRGVAVLDDHGVGPITVGEAMELLGHCHVSVRPVLDIRDQLPVDTYEIPPAMREALRLSRPSSVFPFSASDSHAGDVDHTIPSVAVDRGGPPGQTRIDNLGPMTRFAHRVKTHGRGWRHLQPSAGVYLWRTPHGYWFRVDQHGTTALGQSSPTIETVANSSPRSVSARFLAVADSEVTTLPGRRTAQLGPVGSGSTVGAFDYGDRPEERR